MRGPAGVPVGELRRINISNVVVYNADPRYASIIAGLPGHMIEDVKLSNIRIYYQGGGTREQAGSQPPERETNYPEPSMFGEIPAYGFFIRHAQGIEMNNVAVSYLKEDFRPAFVITGSSNTHFSNVTAQKAPGTSVFDLRNVDNFSTSQCPGVPDMHLDRVTEKKF